MTCMVKKIMTRLPLDQIRNNSIRFKPHLNLVFPYDGYKGKHNLLFRSRYSDGCPNLRCKKHRISNEIIYFCARIKYGY